MFSFIDPGLAEDRGCVWVGHAHWHDQARLPPICCGVLHLGLGGWPHLVRDQAALGRRSQGVHQRHVERGGLHHQLPLRGHHRTENCGLFWRSKPPYFLINLIILSSVSGFAWERPWYQHRELATWRLGHVGPNFDIRGTVCCRQHLLLIKISLYFLCQSISRATAGERA